MMRDKYDVILADPPWQYADKCRHRGGAERHYRTMRLDALMALPVGDIASPNAALFLWATWPNLLAAMDVMSAWGFRYRTCAFVWVKTTATGKHAIGMGHYTRANSEPVLLAVRGRMPVDSRSVRQVVLAQRARHSEKPADVYDRIESLYPDTRRAELFARQPREGWDAFGDEIDGRPINEALRSKVA